MLGRCIGNVIRQRNAHSQRTLYETDCLLEPEEAADFQTPAEVKWEDGSIATLEDYAKHQLCTQSVHPTEHGLVTVTRFDFSPAVLR